MKFGDVPTTYTEMYEAYLDWTRSYIYRKFNIYGPDNEDMAQDVFARFIERDFLTQFDPSKGSFPAWWATFVYVYVRGYSERAVKLRKRYPAIMNMPVGEGDEVWGDLFAGVETFEEESVGEMAYRDTLKQCRAAIDAVRVRKTTSTQPVTYQLAYEVFEQTLAEQPDVFSLAYVSNFSDKTGMSKASGYNWLKKLRAKLQEVA